MSQQSYRVLKFGGSSLGATDRVMRVLSLIARERQAGPIAMVVSAMGDTTDWLIEAMDIAVAGDAERAEQVVDRVATQATTLGLMTLQRMEADGRTLGSRPEVFGTVREVLGPLRRLLFGVSLVREKTPQTLDLVMSFGERLSASVISDLLDAYGLPAIAVDSRDWTVTDATFGNAIVDWPATQETLTALRQTWGDRVAVSTGFLGRTRDGRTTTLGRNGSDYTATLLARGLQAAEVVRWTDVSGVMTADPGIVRDAYPLARLSYMEALELANFGARVFHPRTMIPLIESGIPMRIRNTVYPDDPGTLIDATGAKDDQSPTSVTSLEKLALLDIECRQISFASRESIGARVLRVLDSADVTVWMANQSAHGQAVAVVVPLAEVDVALAAINTELAPELDRGDFQAVGVRKPVTLLTLVAEAMGRTANVAGRFFHTLGSIGVNVRAIAQGASSRSISCAIDAADTHVAVRTVHAAFNFAHHEISVLVYGRGTVGAQLLEQIVAQQKSLAEKHRTVIRVVGVVCSHWSVFADEGVPTETIAAIANGSYVGEGRETDEQLLDRLRRLPAPVLVDVTAAVGMEDLYVEAFKRGIHVVGANKKPLTISSAKRAQVVNEAAQNHRGWYYETTVGASLPVIDTLKNLVRTGDRVHEIEGAFSGTIGYLCNELMNGVALGTAVRRAREMGYTEPNPADDLSGLDVARKVLILARELGIDIELDNVTVEPFVPERVLNSTSIDAFFAALDAYEPEFRAIIDAKRAAGLTLRYLGRINAMPEDGRYSVSVSPVWIPADHPAHRLRGAEAFVAFTTDRYSQFPLIVQGAGAGGAVTAAGVLADVLKVSLTALGR